MKFGTNVPRMNTHRLTVSVFGYDVILARCRPGHLRHFAKILYNPRRVMSLVRCMRYSS